MLSEGASMPTRLMRAHAEIQRKRRQHAGSAHEGDADQIQSLKAPLTACMRHDQRLHAFRSRLLVGSTRGACCQYSGPPLTEWRGISMLNRSLAIIAACAGVFSFNAEARPVSTDDCLKRGQCAYVSPNGRVTCGKCPGQVIKIPADTTAVCKDGAFDNRKTRSGACKNHGGVIQFLDPNAKSAER